MTAGKYVIIDEIMPVIFKAPLSHKDMRTLGNITSAGYFVRDGKSVIIAGEAITISVPNGKHDKELLERFFAETEAVL